VIVIMLGPKAKPKRLLEPLYQALLAPVPWFAANMMGFMGEVSGYAPFVKPFLTRDQVKNLKFDNVVADDALGFSELGISLETLEAIVPSYLGRYRKYGQFHERRS